MNSCGDQCRRYGHAAPRSDRGGFTIVELLVVFAILALLVALLMPGLNRARAATKRVGCASNLKQLALAWTAYLDANDGYFLKDSRDLRNANFNFGGQQCKAEAWCGSVRFHPDLPNRTPEISKPLNTHLNIPEVAFSGAEVFRCPADEGYDHYRPSFFEYWGTSYEANVLLVGPEHIRVFDEEPCKEVFEELDTRLRRLQRVQVGNPGKVALLGDIGWAGAWVPGNTLNIARHGEPNSFNLAFLDAHVDFIRIQKGLYVTKKYTVIPFADLQNAALECQEEIED